MSFDERHLVFAGARGPATAADIWSPRTTLGKITGRALAPLNIEVTIDSGGFGPNNPALVADGRADLGSYNLDFLRFAFDGTYDHQSDGPRRNLRVLAAINFPAWLGVAVRAESGITDLGQVVKRQYPLRVVTTGAEAVHRILAYYGLSRELIESWGGKFMRATSQSFSPFIPTGDFDLIMDAVYAAYTPEARHWWEASVLHNLRFLPLPDDLIKQICTELGGEPGFIPHQLMRGVVGDVPAVERLPHAIYTRDEMPAAQAHTIAQALDAGRHLFRQVFIPFSYDPRNVARTYGLPLHEGAERYYREMGYLA